MTRLRLCLLLIPMLELGMFGCGGGDDFVQTGGGNEGQAPGTVQPGNGENGDEDGDNGEPGEGEPGEGEPGEGEPPEEPVDQDDPDQGGTGTFPTPK